MAKKLNYTLTQVEYVLAVAKHGHFAKAAEACGVTQPTLSMQIQKLESDLDVVIFDRSKKPILLTDVGKLLVEQMQNILYEAGKVDSLIQSAKSSRTEGELVFGVIPTIAPYLLPRFLPVLDKRYPGVKLRILELQTQRIVEALGNDEIDVGILATPLKIPRIFEYPLYYETFSVLCRKEHPLAQLKKLKYDSLHFEDIWLLEEGHCLRHQVLDVCDLRVRSEAKRKYKFESGSLETLKDIIEANGGYTLIPSLARERVGRGSVLREFERPIPAREIGLVYRREHHKNDLLEAIGECILESIPEEVRKIRRKDLDVLPIE